MQFARQHELAGFLLRCFFFARSSLYRLSLQHSRIHVRHTDNRSTSLEPSEHIHAPLTPAERSRYERTVAKARKQLGKEAYAAAIEEGESMTRDQVIKFALDMADQNQQSSLLK